MQLIEAFEARKIAKERKKSYCMGLDDGADHTGAEIALLTAGNEGR